MLSSAAEPGPVGPSRRRFGNPYAQLALSILFSAAAQVFLKLGAGTGAGGSWLGLEGLRSGWVWMGIGALVASLFSWLYALRFVPLSIAFTLAGAVHALVPIASWIWLGETISGKRGLGILLVIAGVVISAKPATAVEEKL
jgi:multidrug transporter EmrE-like cation transporter